MRNCKLQISKAPLKAKCRVINECCTKSEGFPKGSQE